MTPFEEFLLAFVVLALGIVTGMVLWVVVQVRKPLTDDDRAYMRGQIREYQSLYEAQRAAELADIRAQVRALRQYAADVTAAYGRLANLYNAMRQFLAVLGVHLQTWPEVAKDLPTYSAADPPVLPPWPLEDEPRKS
jgi:hypothetical protein